MPLTISRQTLVALSAIALMAWVHIRGVGHGRLVGNVLAVLKVSALLMFIALGFSIGSGSSTNLRVSAGPVMPTSWLLALIPVMFTYSGWKPPATSPKRFASPAATCRARLPSAPRRSSHLLVAERAVSVCVAG